MRWMGAAAIRPPVDRTSMGGLRQVRMSRNETQPERVADAATQS